MKLVCYMVFLFISEEYERHTVPVHVVIFIIMIIYVHIRMLEVLYVRMLNF